MLTGELVRLRALEPSDAEALWRWNSDPDVMRWMDEGYPASQAQVAARCEERERNSYDNMLLAIETLGEGRLIGVTRLGDTEPETGRAELDIYIGEKDCWGKGYGTEATRLICRYGFDRMRLHSIALWVVAENAAAIRVYEKVGFVRDGRHRHSFRRDGRWYDQILMSMLEGELLG
ncbi:GNAT family N-acetyltransferase [Planomonospora corallina]|uniref:GNAT family N-acetyltransferase n=1 Tax=Planomonospora corallina TaxID=1806052 RepID=A0ABV8IBS3_9ACTN